MFDGDEMEAEPSLEHNCCLSLADVSDIKISANPIFVERGLRDNILIGTFLKDDDRKVWFASHRQPRALNIQGCHQLGIS